MRLLMRVVGALAFGVALVVMLGAPALVFWKFGSGTPPSDVQLAAIATLFAAALATLGWNFTTHEARIGEARRYTIDLLNKSFDDPVHGRLQTGLYAATRDPVLLARTDLFELYCTLHHRPDYGDCVTYYQSGTTPSAPADDFTVARQIYAVGRFCDRYELLAFMIRHGRIEETLAREMLSDNLFLVCDQLQDFILTARSQDPAYYEHLAWLDARWSGKRSRLAP